MINSGVGSHFKRRKFGFVFISQKDVFNEIN